MPDGLGVSQRITAGVLVIDDDTDLVHSFSHVLAPHGIPVVAARDEYEGLAAFRWSPPAVVLTDILMPEWCRTAMAMRRARPATKIVAISRGGNQERSNFLVFAKKFGADAIVHRPFEASDLVKLLRTYVLRH
jgi:CheY-like chemotaxis protein